MNTIQLLPFTVLFTFSFFCLLEISDPVVSSSSMLSWLRTQVWSQTSRSLIQCCGWLLLGDNDTAYSPGPDGNELSSYMNSAWNDGWYMVSAQNVHAIVTRVLNHFSRIWLPETLRTVAHQAPLSMGFSRQEYWSGLPCPPPGDLPDPGIEPMSLMCLALAGGFFTTSATWGHHYTGIWNIKINKAIYWAFLCILLREKCRVQNIFKEK